MNIKNIIIVSVLSILLVSCYQAANSASGAISVNINYNTAKDAPAGFDGVLKLAVFNEGEIESLIDQTFNVISYTGDFPDPILANNSVPINGRTGLLSLTNIPADRPLTLLVEYYGPYYESGSDYYHSFTGISDTFEVKGGDSEDISVILYETDDGIISFYDSTFYDVYIEIYEPEILDSYITLAGSNIIFNPNSPPERIYFNTFGSVMEPILIGTSDMLPGKKMKIFVRSSQSIFGGETIGISDTFELQPGRTLEVPVSNYYTYQS